MLNHDVRWEVRKTGKICLNYLPTEQEILIGVGMTRQWYGETLLLMLKEFNPTQDSYIESPEHPDTLGPFEIREEVERDTFEIPNFSYEIPRNFMFNKLRVRITITKINL